jgi:hypothetical protein
MVGSWSNLYELGNMAENGDLGTLDPVTGVFAVVNSDRDEAS